MYHGVTPWSEPRDARSQVPPTKRRGIARPQAREYPEAAKREADDQREIAR